MFSRNFFRVVLADFHFCTHRVVYTSFLHLQSTALGRGHNYTKIHGDTQPPGNWPPIYFSLRTRATNFGPSIQRQPSARPVDSRKTTDQTGDCSSSALLFFSTPHCATWFEQHIVVFFWEEVQIYSVYYPIHRDINKKVGKSPPQKTTFQTINFIKFPIDRSKSLCGLIYWIPSDTITGLEGPQRPHVLVAPHGERPNYCPAFYISKYPPAFLRSI